MLSLFLAAALLQGAPDAATVEPTAANGLPKTDYELVAWCHGALAGQLELEPRAHAAMVTVEGKAKVAARAKEDAEMEKERRQYLKDYEHALAAAESASPTPIHKLGVDAELHGYALWTATRNKEPLWLMLDWGMWDPNDVGCGDAAERLFKKSKLLGMALKDSEPDTSATDDTKSTEKPVDKPEVETAAAPVAADGINSATPNRLKRSTLEDVKPAEAPPEAQTDAKPADMPADSKPAEPPPADAKPDAAPAQPTDDKPAAPADPQPAPATPPPSLRGPQ